MPRKHTVLIGEGLTAIAHRYKLSPERLWEANTSLHQKRPSPDQLLAGDVLDIPDMVPLQETLQAGQWHTIKCGAHRRPIALRLRTFGRPREGLAWKMTIPNFGVVQGETDGEGLIEASVPLGASHVKIEVTSESGRLERYHLDLGALDPINTVSGVQQRLKNLSIDCPETGEADEATIAAIQLFEDRAGLDPITGDPEGLAFLDALREAHGC